MLTQPKKKDILELSREQLVAWLAERKIEKYRADQILKWVYLRQADSFELMTDISKEIRTMLPQHFEIGRLGVERTETSRDGSRKYLFKLKDGRLIESVLIPERDHFTLCVSSQVGCAQGCLFCLTATGGFERNLIGFRSGATMCARRSCAPVPGPGTGYPGEPGGVFKCHRQRYPYAVDAH